MRWMVALCAVTVAVPGVPQEAAEPADVGSIAGVVLDPDGKSVANTPIELWWSMWPTQEARGGAAEWGGRWFGAQYVTGAAGEYTYPEVRPGYVRVSAQIHGMLGAQSELVKLEAGQQLTGVVVKSPGWGGNLVGTVLDEAGQPVEGALVAIGGYAQERDVVKALAEPRDTPYRNVTGPDGWFAFNTLSAGQYQLSVYSEGYPRLHLPGLAVPERGELSLDLTLRRCLPQTWTLSGRLVDEGGLGIVGASLQVSFARAGSAAARQTSATYVSGDVGQFLLYDLPPDTPVRVSAYHPGFGLWQAELTVAAEEYREVEAKPDRGVILAGTVSYPDRSPVRQEEIEFELTPQTPDGKDARERALKARVTTDEEGRYRLAGLTAGRWRVSLPLKDQHTYKLDALTVPEGQAEARLEVVFPPAATIAGALSDPDGQLPEQVWVGLSLRDTQSYGVMRQIQVPRTGGFRFLGLDPGAYTVTAVVPGFFPATCDVDVSEGQTAEGLELLLGQGATISGRVVDEKGTPVPNVPIRIEPTSAYRGTPQPWRSAIYMGRGDLTTSDSEGRFVIRGVTAEELSLVATTGVNFYTWPPQAEYPSRNVQGRLVPLPVKVRQSDGRFAEAGGILIRQAKAGDSADVRLVLAKWVRDEDLCRVKGTITDPAHVLGEGAQLRVALDTNPFGSGMFLRDQREMPSSRDSASADERGAFEVANLEPGDYYVIAGSGTRYFQVGDVRLEKGATVDLGALPIPTAGAVEGDVTDREGRSLTKGWAAAARQAQELRRYSPSARSQARDLFAVDIGPEGHYRFEPLDPGYWFVTTGGEGVPLSAVQRVFVNGGTVRLDFKHAYDGSVVGRVADPQGNPVVGASVSCQSSILGNVGRVATDQDGRCTFEGLPAGTYTVSAYHQRYIHADPVEIQVREGGPPAMANVTLRPGAILNGRLVAAAGEQPRWDPNVYTLELWQDGRRLTNLYLVPDGRFSSPGLPAGTYVIKCTRRDSQKVLGESEPIAVAEGQMLNDLVVELAAE